MKKTTFALTVQRFFLRKANQNGKDMTMKHLLRLADLPITEINRILDCAQAAKTGIYDDSETKRIVANLFFEP